MSISKSTGYMEIVPDDSENKDIDRYTCSIIDNTLSNNTILNYDQFENLYMKSSDNMENLENTLYNEIKSLRNINEIILSLLLFTFIFSTDFYYRMIPDDIPGEEEKYNKNFEDLIELPDFTDPARLINILNIFMRKNFESVYQLEVIKNNTFLNFANNIILPIYLKNLYNYPKDFVFSSDGTDVLKIVCCDTKDITNFIVKIRKQFTNYTTSQLSHPDSSILVKSNLTRNSKPHKKRKKSSLVSSNRSSMKNKFKSITRRRYPSLKTQKIVKRWRRV